MKLFGLDITRANNRVKPEFAKIEPIDRSHLRSAQDIDRWRRSITDAENVYNYDRRLMQELFMELEYDAHISAVVNQIVAEIQGSDFRMAIDGETDETATKVIQHPWFQDFIRYVLEAEFYGYTLIEFGSSTPTGFEYIKSIDRRYIVPEYKVVKKDLYGYGREGGIPFMEAPYNEWTLWFDCYGFGLFNKAAPLWIYKKQAYNYWAEYQQIFSMPLRVGKTDIRDTSRRDNMTAMLRDMGAAAWGVFDADDTVEFIQSASSSGNPVFEALINNTNGEISKLFLGQTMTTEDGSSRSQAEVHENTKLSIMEMYYRKVEDAVNLKLIPMMQRHRIISTTPVFEFMWSEKDMSQTEKIDAISKLAPYFDFDPEYIDEFLGIKVNTRVVPIMGSPLNRLKQYYGSTESK
jgi:phage gp29-like protein